MIIGNINHNANTYGIHASYACKRSGADSEKKYKDSKEEAEKSTTDTDIVVRPDGSRVLVMTTNIGNMTTSVSLKISDPTAMPNESPVTDRTEEADWHIGTM